MEGRKKVQIRNGFSDRNNINKLNDTIQIDSFDKRTRVQLHNCIISGIEINSGGDKLAQIKIYQEILNDAYCEVIDNYFSNIDQQLQACKGYIKDTFLSEESEYDEILSLVEYIANLLDNKYIPLWKGFIDNYRSYGNCSYAHTQRDYITDKINELFEKECVGYRFIGEHIVAITDKVEIHEIEESLRNDYNGCKAHIEKAVGFLSDREQKDYKNCIKESISAVETICQIIIGSNTATLNKAIQKLKNKGIKIHPVLETAFTKLYAYTSDEGGIRHAEGLFVSEVSFEEAKFMLVSCSAFVNYLIAEYGKIVKD